MNRKTEWITKERINEQMNVMVAKEWMNKKMNGINRWKNELMNRWMEWIGKGIH